MNDLAANAKASKAERILLRALKQSGGKCAACHRELAVLYEAKESLDMAVAEWESYLKEQDPVLGADIRVHVEELRRKRDSAR